MNAPLKHYVLSIGSNLEPREQRIKGVEVALEWLRTKLMNVKASSVYETPEVHGIGTPYFNSVLAGDTPLELEELNEMLKEYELSHGRDAESRVRKIVPIDIDIVICDDRIIRPRDYAQDFFKIGYYEIS